MEHRALLHKFVELAPVSEPFLGLTEEDPLPSPDNAFALC